MVTRSKKDPAPHVGIPLGGHIEEYLHKPTFDADGVQVTSGIGHDGREYPDPCPMSPPVGYTPPNDLMWMIQHMIRSEKARELLAQEDVETEDEANDFDCEDDPLDELTQYERVFEPPAPTPPTNAAANLPPAASPPAASLANTAVASPAPGSTSGTAGYIPDTGSPTQAPAPGSLPAK